MLLATLGMKLLYIPCGSFTMGSPYDEERRQQDEEPRLVRFEKGFYTSASEVTRAQWHAVCGEGDSRRRV